MGSTEYRLYRNWTLIMMFWVGPAVFLIVGVFLLYSTLAHPTPRAMPPAMMGIWFAFVAWISFRLLRVPRRIVTHDDGRIEFIGVVGRVELAPRDIVAIRPERGQLGFLTVVHSSGRVRLLNQFDGFHEFLSRLKSANPGVELHGC